MFKLIRFIYEVIDAFFAIVAHVINDNSDHPIKCLNLDLNILIVMLETELKRLYITDIMSSENWFMYRSYLAIL